MAQTNSSILVREYVNLSTIDTKSTVLPSMEAAFAFDLLLLPTISGKDFLKCVYACSVYVCIQLCFQNLMRASKNWMAGRSLGTLDLDSVQP